MTLSSLLLIDNSCTGARRVGLSAVVRSRCAVLSKLVGSEVAERDTVGGTHIARSIDEYMHRTSALLSSLCGIGGGEETVEKLRSMLAAFSVLSTKLAPYIRRKG